MKIQFIVVGWHFEPDYINGLIELQNSNEFIDVFWVCHKDPPVSVSDNFDFQIFPNEGLDEGGYQQGLDYLKLDDDVVVFLTHDDIIIKDWSFINECLSRIDYKSKFVGNCTNYAGGLIPDQTIREWSKGDSQFDADNIGVVNNKFDNKTIKELIKSQNQHLFVEPRRFRTLRSSFICSKVEYINGVGGFEPMGIVMEKDNNDNYSIKGYKGYGGLGNLILYAFAYKIDKIYGSDSISYLSNRYLDSDFIYEMTRGKIDEQHKLT